MALWLCIGYGVNECKSYKVFTLIFAIEGIVKICRIPGRMFDGGAQRVTSRYNFFISLQSSQ